MWADRFVGLPYKVMGRDRHGLDCYGLVRLVLAEEAGHIFPSYLDEDPDGATIADRARAFSTVSHGEAKPLDVAIMLTQQLENNQWVFRPIHMGIYVKPDRVLHIDKGHSSRVQHVSKLKIESVLRVT